MSKKRPQAKSAESAKNPAAPAWQRALLFRAVWMIRGILLLAGGIAAYLLWHTLTHERVGGCGPGSPCDRVLGSHWAYIGPIPVSAPALAAYGLFFFTTFQLVPAQTTRFRPRPWLLATMLAASLTGAAAWFIWIQLAQIGAFCKFCLSAHGAAIGASLVFLAALRRCAIAKESGVKPQYTLQKSHAAMAAAIGIASVAILAAVQTAFPHRMNVVRVHKGTFKLDLRELPRLGSASANRVFVSLFDYTCPDCRDMHKILTAALQRYGDQLAIAALPMPLDGRCNPLVRKTQKKHEKACDFAKLGLALRRISNAAFVQFDDWIFEQRETPSLEEAEEKARQIAGAEPLKTALADPWVAQTIQTSVSLYELNGSITSAYKMPQLVIGDRVSVGRLKGPEDLYSLLEQNLGVVPPK